MCRLDTFLKPKVLYHPTRFKRDKKKKLNKLKKSFHVASTKYSHHSVILFSYPACFRITPPKLWNTKRAFTSLIKATFIYKPTETFSLFIGILMTPSIQQSSGI